MRSIPGTMATQHPDNAFAPYWDTSTPFIGTYREIAEAVACFKDLNVSEYMWDWEGKHADAAVIDRLFSDYHNYFAAQQLGRDKFLTFRLPNIWEEKGYNLLQAMTVLLSGEDFARDLQMAQRPLFEVILPMTERADQLMHIHYLFEKLAAFKSKEFTSDTPDNTGYLELIPLVESVESQLAIGSLLEDYVRLHKKHFKRQPEYLRPFLACSDSALSSGMLAATLGNKVALARIYEFSANSKIPVFPIAGAGSLSFRGGLMPTPASIERFTTELPGMRTVTVQSSFRYDHPKATVKKAIAQLERELPRMTPIAISPDHQQALVRIGSRSAGYYKDFLKAAAGSMQQIFAQMPKRRDRRQHIGLLSYSRSVGAHTMPRAITFTGSFYSIGIPPEFIGLGRTLQELKPAELALLQEQYPHLTSDIQAAGRYLNKDNLELFAKGGSAWTDIQTDVTAAETVLGVKFGPHTKDEQEHVRLSTELTKTKGDTAGRQLISTMAELRKSIG